MKQRQIEMSLAVTRFLRSGRIAQSLRITDEAFASLLRWCLSGSTRRVSL